MRGHPNPYPVTIWGAGELDVTSSVRIGAVMLAAGFGTRLAPLTDVTPKPLLEVGGRPVLDHLLELVDDLDPDARVAVVASDQHVGEWRDWQRTQSSRGDRLVVISNGVTRVDERLGAVADLALGLEALAAGGDIDHVVVLAGDNLLTEPLGPHVDAASAAQLSVVLCRDLGDVAAVPPGRFGEITADDDGRIVRFREKPQVPESSLAATCTYVLAGRRARALVEEYLVDGDADSPGTFIAWLAQREPVLARPLIADYYDIGNYETLTAARAAFNQP